MPASPVGSESILEALRRWRAFASRTQVTWAGRKRSWAEHIKDAGYVDEERLVQPVAFPAFARELLGYDPGADLAAEETNTEGTPDFTPADAVTHPFVFETKSLIRNSGRRHQHHCRSRARWPEFLIRLKGN